MQRRKKGREVERLQELIDNPTAYQEAIARNCVDFEEFVEEEKKKETRGTNRV